MKISILVALFSTISLAAHAFPRTVVADTERGSLKSIAYVDEANAESLDEPIVDDEDLDETSVDKIDEAQDQYDYEGWIWNLVANDPEMFTENVSVKGDAKVVIDVSKSSQRGKILINGKEVESFKLSTGLRLGDTPSGTFKPGARKVNWLSNFASKKYGRAIYLKHAVQIKGGSFMHAASTGAMNYLGQRRSSGCVRVPPRIAAKVYGLVNSNPGRTVFRVH